MKAINGKNINEVVRILGEYGDEAKIIAGGTDVVINLKNKKISPKVLIDISKIEELRFIEEDKDYIRIGAGTTFTDMTEEPLFRENLYGLYKACSMVGSPQIRNKGTIGGNIANGSAAADSIPPLMAVGSLIKLLSMEGIREIKLEEYYDEPVRDNEIITEIKFKKPKDNEMLTFSKLGLRKALAISRLSISALIGFDEKNIETIRVSSGALGKYPMREYAVEEFLLEKELNEETIDGAIKVIQESMDDRLRGRATLPYKRNAVAGILKNALKLSLALREEVKA